MMRYIDWLVGMVLGFTGVATGCGGGQEGSARQGPEDYPVRPEKGEPDAVSDQGTRSDPRVKVLAMTVRYKSATIDEFIQNHSHDVSRGGIFIKTSSPFPPGTLLKFESGVWSAATVESMSSARVANTLVLMGCSCSMFQATDVK